MDGGKRGTDERVCGDQQAIEFEVTIHPDPINVAE